jgi:hypothetical protein
MANSAPVELVLVEFPGNEFKGEIVDELRRLVDSGTITLIDVLLIRKDADGSAEWLEASDAGDGALADLAGEPAGLLAEEDVEAVAAELEPNSSVGMLLFEHSWAAQLTEAIRRADGRLIDWARVPAAAIDELSQLIEKED